KNKENGVNVYENDYYVPMGFVYEDFITEEEYYGIETESRHLLLMKAMVLSQDQMKKYSKITGYYDGKYDKLNSKDENEKMNFKSKTYSYIYTEEQYLSDCKSRSSTSCTSFEYTNEGFKATINNKEGENLLFFSVPYEKGFTAYVNGKKTDIEKVNTGFMAVKIPGNKKSEIVFKYETPGFKAGIAVTFTSVAVFIIYMIYYGGFVTERKKFRNRRLLGRFYKK
ncbi:MAG: YfhO family protein, partial [Acutalibacteraceae bacterium]